MRIQLIGFSWWPIVCFTLFPIIEGFACSVGSSQRSEEGSELADGGNIDNEWQNTDQVFDPDYSAKAFWSRVNVSCEKTGCLSGTLDGLDRMARIVHFDLNLLEEEQQRLLIDYAPPKLISIPPDYQATSQPLESLSLGYFMLLSDAAAKAGMSLQVLSGFRSFCTQCSLFWNYVDQYGLQEADTFSARPGHSEHQLGRIADMTAGNGNYMGGPYDIPDVATAQPEVYQWVDEHAYLYGWINSFPPQDDFKEAIDFPYSTRTCQYTDYLVEPWHWRFVGKKAAALHHRLYVETSIRLSFNEFYDLLYGLHADPFDDLTALQLVLEEIQTNPEDPDYFKDTQDLVLPDPRDFETETYAAAKSCKSLGWISTCGATHTNVLVFCDEPKQEARVIMCEQGCKQNTSGESDRCNDP